jgi:hypothetical protein
LRGRWTWECLPCKLSQWLAKCRSKGHQSEWISCPHQQQRRLNRRWAEKKWMNEYLSPKKELTLQSNQICRNKFFHFQEHTIISKRSPVNAQSKTNPSWIQWIGIPKRLRAWASPRTWRIRI